MNDHRAREPVRWTVKHINNNNNNNNFRVIYKITTTLQWRTVITSITYTHTHTRALYAVYMFYNLKNSKKKKNVFVCVCIFFPMFRRRAFIISAKRSYKYIYIRGQCATCRRQYVLCCSMRVYVCSGTDEFKKKKKRVYTYYTCVRFPF